MQDAFAYYAFVQRSNRLQNPRLCVFSNAWIAVQQQTTLCYRRLFYSVYTLLYVYVCVFSSHSFWTSSSLDVPAVVTQEESHTGFLTNLLPAVRALIFLARSIQSFLPLVDREVEVCVLTI